MGEKREDGLRFQSIFRLFAKKKQKKEGGFFILGRKMAEVLAIEQKRSFFSKSWDFLKSYTVNCSHAYLDFVAPVAMFLVFNACAEMHLRDGERMGLLWLHYSQVEDAQERETKFPVFAPESKQQRKRMDQVSQNAAVKEL